MAVLSSMLDVTSGTDLLFPIAGLDEWGEGIKRDLRDAIVEDPEWGVQKSLRTHYQRQRKVSWQIRGKQRW